MSKRTTLDGSVKPHGHWLYKPAYRSGVEGKVIVIGAQNVLTCVQRYVHGLPIRWNGVKWHIEGVETYEPDEAIVDLHRE